jgi:hypothetical protein
MSLNATISQDNTVLNPTVSQDNTVLSPTISQNTTVLNVTFSTVAPSVGTDLFDATFDITFN